MISTSNDTASKLVEIIKAMKPRQQNKCIQSILSVWSKSRLYESGAMQEWLNANGFLSEEKYI